MATKQTNEPVGFWDNARIFAMTGALAVGALNAPPQPTRTAEAPAAAAAPVTYAGLGPQRLRVHLIVGDQRLLLPRISEYGAEELQRLDDRLEAVAQHAERHERVTLEVADAQGELPACPVDFKVPPELRTPEAFRVLLNALSQRSTIVRSVLVCDKERALGSTDQVPSAPDDFSDVPIAPPEHVDPRMIVQQGAPEGTVGSANTIKRG